MAAAGIAWALGSGRAAQGCSFHSNEGMLLSGEGRGEKARQRATTEAKKDGRGRTAPRLTFRTGSMKAEERKRRGEREEEKMAEGEVKLVEEVDGLVLVRRHRIPEAQLLRAARDEGRTGVGQSGKQGEMMMGEFNKWVGTSARYKTRKDRLKDASGNK